MTTLKNKEIQMNMNKKETEINLGGGYNLDLRSSRIVSTKQTLYLSTAQGSIPLNVDISCDFDSIPKEYHEVFLNIFSAKYLNRVSFGDNPFSQCLPAPTKRWWQFWKKKNSEL
jgi:hypothetical protein